jgi:glycosyltransferase involved in cell wall biosynthesis
MLTAVVLTKTGEDSLSRCLNSLKFCHQVLIITDGSSSAITIPNSQNFKVIEHPLNSDFSQQRNFALAQISSGWVLFIDSDEEVSSSLAAEIIQTINHTQLRGFYLNRIDTLWNRQLLHGDSAVSLIRLAKFDSGKWQGAVHETWEVKGGVGRLKAILNHYPHPRLSEFISDLNFYSTLRAQELFENHKRTNIISIIAYSLGKFLLIYLIKVGFLDGMPGLVSALSMSFYSFLVRGKLYLLTKKNSGRP